MHNVLGWTIGHRGLLVWAVAALLNTPPVQAAETDHPLLSGMAGFEIRSKKVIDFDQVQDSPVECDPVTCKTAAIKDGTFRAEGLVTNIDYSATKDAGELAILRNYEHAIRSLGGTLVNPRLHTFGRHVFKIEKDGAITWVVLNIVSASGYRLAIIEPAVMQQTVTAGQLADQIKKQGFATIYINFDTAKSDIKPEAQDIIKAIATLLKNNAELKLSVEGHTDNVGDAKSNKTLSAARARAVMRAVIMQDINPKRLGAAGFGMEQPVADNRTEEGRAKNRRVELVKR